MTIGILLIVYGVVNEIGGLIGFLKAKSRASLMAGGISGSVLMAAGALEVLGAPIGRQIGFGATLALCAVFGMRFSKTKGFMPAGMMLLISVAVAGALGYLMFV